MNFINLIGNSGIPSTPLTESPKDSKARRTHNITMCGCGRHPVNPKKDVYKQHNHWLRQQMGGPVELGHSQLQDATPNGASIKKFEPTYDFSGEDFEMSPEELRKVRDEQGI